MQIFFDVARERSKELYKELIDDNIDGQGHYSFHSQIELYFVEEGQIDAFINHQWRRLEKDQMAVSLSYDAHMYRSVGSSRSSILVIPPELCREFSAAVKNKQVKNPFICHGETVRRIKTFLNEIKEQSANLVKQRGCIYMILGIVLENLFLAPTEDPAETELSSRILFYLNQNFRQEITLDSLAAEFGYSKSYLSRYFKACFGIGCNQYIHTLRLRNAILLLQEGNHTHTYCALESGFTSMRTFYRVFQQEFGCTPAAYLSARG